MKSLKWLVPAALLAGAVAGWLASSVRHREEICRYRNALSPEIQQALMSSEAVMKGMTPADMKAALQDMREFAKRVNDQDDAVALYEAMLAFRVHRVLREEGREAVSAMLAQEVQDLRTRTAEGAYAGTELEKLSEATLRAAEREMDAAVATPEPPPSP